MLVRDYHFNLDEDKIFTYAKGRIPTRILNSLSLLFPRGERFFIESVRKFENQITDEQLRKDIKTFYQQEGRHGREHRKLNAILQKHGLDVAKVEEQIMKRLSKYSHDEQHELLVTVCLERITGLLGHVVPAIDRFVLRNNQYCDLWRYHAIEELEHVHVADEVMKRVGKLSKTKDAFYMCLAVKELIEQTIINYRILAKLEQQEKKK